MIDRTGCTWPRHGTRANYDRGCRCPDAREAHRLYRKRRREGRALDAYIDATGTRRRLQALAAIGWSAPALAARSTVTSTMISYLRQPSTGPLVRRDIAAVVTALYDRWSGTPGPCGRVRGAARHNRYAPPLAWDDDAIDDPAASPVTVLETRRDVAAEARFLASFGESLEHIAAQLGVLPTSVERAVYRKEAS